MTQNTPSRAGSPLITGAGAVLFIAFVVAGTGIVSFATASDPIEYAGLGPWPGVLGVLFATVVWIAVMAPRRAKRGLPTGLLAGLGAAAAYVLATSAVALLQGTEASLAVLSHLVTSWFPLAVVLAGVLAALFVLVSERAGGATAKWPWERDDEE